MVWNIWPAVVVSSFLWVPLNNISCWYINFQAALRVLRHITKLFVRSAKWISSAEISSPANYSRWVIKDFHRARIHWTGWNLISPHFISIRSVCVCVFLRWWNNLPHQVMRLQRLRFFLQRQIWGFFRVQEQFIGNTALHKIKAGSQNSRLFIVQFPSHLLFLDVQSIVFRHILSMHIPQWRSWRADLQPTAHMGRQVGGRLQKA